MRTNLNHKPRQPFSFVSFWHKLILHIFQIIINKLLWIKFLSLVNFSFHALSELNLSTSFPKCVLFPPNGPATSKQLNCRQVYYCKTVKISLIFTNISSIVSCVGELSSFASLFSTNGVPFSQ